MTTAKHRNEHNIFWAMVTLALPSMLEQILSVLMQYVDTAMVGHLGADATAAVSTSTTITWLIGSVPYAFGVAALFQESTAMRYSLHLGLPCFLAEMWVLRMAM